MIPYGKRKSRAAQTTILNNQIYSAEGGPPSCQTANTSFDIDVPNGDVAMITGNTIVQGPSAQNHKMVVYGGEGLPYANNSATFATNTFISTANSIAIEDLSYLYVTPCIPMIVAADNTFTGVSQVVYPPECEASAAPPSPPPPPPPPPPPGTPPSRCTRITITTGKGREGTYPVISSALRIANPRSAVAPASGCRDHIAKWRLRA